MLINISEATLLGIYGMIILYKNKDKTMQVKEIAKILGASENHTAKVMQRLLKAGFIESERGPKGGYKYSEKNNNLSLMDIYETFDGKKNIKNCPMGRKKCPFKRCIFNPFLSKFYNDFYNYLKKTELDSEFIQKFL